MKKLSVLITVLLFIFLLTNPVYAYLDAGSGSMILQLLLGGLAGLAVVLKIFWRRLFAFFRISKKKDSNSPDPGNITEQ